ncbi:MAG TPA: hypothetical protein VKG84_02310, partial [Candidatus Acidoferrales bacterium]|nr:hypothetical protein [Candidatus Acidoferrales bacterium]
MGHKGAYIPRLLAALLSGLLIVPSSLTAPQLAAVAGPGKDATVRGAQLAQGANVFNGDIVSVPDGGDSVLLFGNNASAHLTGESAVRVFRCEDNSVVQLLHGAVIFRSTPKQPVEVQLGDSITKPDAGHEVIGMVSLSSPTTANIAAQKGSLTVKTMHQGKLQLVREGEMTEARLTSPANGASPNPAMCGQSGGSGQPAAVPSQPSTNAWVLVGLGTTALVIGLVLRGHQP